MFRVMIEVEGPGQEYASNERHGEDVVRELLLALGSIAENLQSPRLMKVVEAAWAPILRDPQDRS